MTPFYDTYASCEHGKELSGSIKDGEISVWLSDYQLLKTDSAPLS